MIYDYKGKLYPDYLKTGNACQFIRPAALHFCKGRGLDVGAGKWPLPGAIPVDMTNGGDAMNLPEGLFNFVFSSHCLEHIPDYVAAVEHWKSRIVSGGILFLYLPHEAMRYWNPQFCRKHRHVFTPQIIGGLLRDLGFENVITTDGHDAYWSFMAVGFVPN